MIDKKTHEIKQDEDKVVYKSLEEIADDLPDNSPRYILLSYPLTLVRVIFLSFFLPSGKDIYRMVSKYETTECRWSGAVTR